MKTIKQLQSEYGISNITMANLLNIAPSSYCDKKNGRRKFQPVEIVMLCEFFEVKVNEVENFLTRDTRNANNVNSA